MYKIKSISKIILLVIILNTILVSCGKVDNYKGYITALETVNSLSSYKFDSIITINLKKEGIQYTSEDKNNNLLDKDITLFLNLKGDIDKKQKVLTSDIQYKTKDTDEYQKVISVTMDDKYIYTEIQPLIKSTYAILNPFLNGITQRELENQVSIITGSKKYIALPLDIFGVDIWGENQKTSEASAFSQQIEKVIKRQLSLNQESFSFDKKQNEYSMNLTNTDIQNLLNNLLDDVSKNTGWYFDAFFKSFKNKSNAETINKVIPNKEEAIAGLENSVSEVKEKVGQLKDVSLVSKISYKKSTKEYTSSLDISHQKLSILNVVQFLTKMDDISIVIPTDFYDCSELIKEITNPTTDTNIQDGGFLNPSNSTPNQNTDSLIKPEINIEFDSWDEEGNDLDPDIGALPVPSETTKPQEENIVPIPYPEPQMEEKGPLPSQNPQPPILTAPEQNTSGINGSAIGIKKINISGYYLDAMYFIKDDYYYISNDGLYSAEGGFSVSTRVIPCENKNITANDLIKNTLAYEKSRIQKNIDNKYEILSTEQQSSGDAAYGIIKYIMNNNEQECFNLYKKEISQDKNFIIETNVIYIPSNSEEIFEREKATFQEILGYMGIVLYESMQ